VRGRPGRGPTGRPARGARAGPWPPGPALLRGLPCHARSASLPVDRVTAAPAAVLLELDAVGRVSLRLLRLVIAPLALGAGERDRDSYSRGHFSVSTSKVCERVEIAPGGLEPPTSAL